MFAWISTLFKAPQPPAEQPKKRQRHALTTGDLVVLELRKGGPGTAVDIAARLNANAGTVGNVLSQLAREKKVRSLRKVGRNIVWGLA